ncbi:hypothetical protein A2U01_0097610, partial [Trifolium medium]|nr:hypothetical protein [Trifolium medium]
MSSNRFSPSRVSRKVLRLVADLKEMLLEDLSLLRTWRTRNPSSG